MSELMKITLTAAFTLLGGTLLFILGEFVKVLVMVPLQKYKEQAQLALDRLEFYANRVTNFFSAEPSKEERQLMDKISSEIRSAATQLRSTYAVIAFRPVLVWLKIIPSSEDLKSVVGSLIFISNTMPQRGDETNREADPIGQNHAHMENVRKTLAKLP